ncbi:choice-of-anchor Q domain-containing protein [Candidatus Halobeggiatoa sp. HSG11]|nr:choice-of-anchor Q domain-containing protein [Candidatus Halobeggiatoa sp. HSG11]
MNYLTFKTQLRFIIAMLVMMFFMFTVTLTQAATIIVTSNTDTGAGSLRQAIVDASSGDTITFDSSLAGQTITTDKSVNGNNTINVDLTIDGTTNNITINGIGDWIFLVNQDKALTFKNITLDIDGGGSNRGNIDMRNSGTLTLDNVTMTNSTPFDLGVMFVTQGTGSSAPIVNISNSTFTNNTPTGMGSAILTMYEGQLTIVNSVFDNNGSITSNQNYGGVITLRINASAQISNSIFSNNTSTQGFGAAILTRNSANLTIDSSLFYNNTSKNGGAIAAMDTSNIILRNSTLYNNTSTVHSGNSVGGIGFYTTSTGKIINSTISGNTGHSSIAGGLYVAAGTNIELKNTIISDSTSGTDCLNNGTISVNTNNLIEDGTCGSTLSGDPMLNSLADNDGDTQTMALQVGSPAIDAGDNGSCESTDQRGAVRAKTTENPCDIGAYEIVQISNSYQLTVSKIGNGTITGDEIDCGTDCDNEFDDQTIVSLTATPDDGWVFEGWSDDCDSNGEVQIDSDKSCTATFVLPSVEISIITTNLAEGIANDSYSLWLNTSPTKPVSITLTENDDLILEPNSLTFDNSNWDTPQTIQVTDIDDNIAEGLHEHIISHTVTSDNTNFNNLPIEDITVQITDDDYAGINISTNEITVNEGDTVNEGNNDYNIVLTSQPISNVTVTLTSDEDTIINPTTLVFTAENWNVPQDITIFVNDNYLDEGTHQHEPVQHQVISEDPNYHELAINNVTVTVIDNDISGVLLSTNELNINEGDIKNITMTLNLIPPQPVTVNLVPEVGITLSPATLTFTANNWDIPQTITVTAVDDDVVINEVNAVHINVSSDDIKYNSLIVDNLIINISDNEKPAVQTSTDQVTLFEEGTGGSYTVSLTVEPTSEVTVALTITEHNQVFPASLTFTPDNWDISQTVNVTTIDDNLMEEDTHFITHKVTSNDIGYHDVLVPDVMINTVDTVKRVDLGKIILECQNCAIKNASVVKLESLPTPVSNYFFPADLVKFELESETTAYLDIYYKNINDLDNFIYRKYGPIIPGNNNTIVWHNFPNATFELVNNMIKVGLTMTDGQSGDDTGIDEIIVDGSSGIVISGKIDLDNITTEKPKISQEVGLPMECNVSIDSVDSICNVGQQIFPEEINIGDNASISNAIFEADVENQGIIGNSVIKEGVTLTGGSLTGTIDNEGTVKNITFVGSELSGGTLSGNITNESQVDGVIKDVELAVGTVVKGGKIAGTITGSPIDKPVITAAEIMPGTILTNVHLSPTVKLSENVILGEGVSISTEPYTPADFGLSAEDIANLTAEQFSKLELEALATFDPEDIASIPPEALTEMEPEQMAVIEGLEGLTEEQFAEIPVEALEGLTEENMGDFSIEVINKLTPDHVATLNPQVFKRMSTKQMSKLLIHFNSSQISIKHVTRLLPNGWQVNENTGALTLPARTKFTPPLLKRKLYPRVSLPKLTNLEAGIGIGGAGENIKTGMENALEEENLIDFVLSQEDSGILNVEGIGDSEGKQYSFIPDADNAIQVDTDKIPIGLAVGPGGFYTVTTPEGQQYKVIPAPKDPFKLSEVTDSKVTVGKRGDVMMKHSNRTRSTEVYEIVMFDPFVEDFAPDNLCIEIFPGELECDGNLRKRSSRAKTRKIEYSDGTAQIIRPTVLSPDIFIEEALKLEGIEQVVYKADGTFAILYQGKPYFVVPNFTVQNERISEPVEPSIVSNGDGSIKYSIAIESETNTRSTEVYEILSFDPFLEAAPDDLCIEIMPGELECDF